jgi:hypothetical protein
MLIRVSRLGRQQVQLQQVAYRYVAFPRFLMAQFSIQQKRRNAHLSKPTLSFFEMMVWRFAFLRLKKVCVDLTHNQCVDYTAQHIEIIDIRSKRIHIAVCDLKDGAAKGLIFVRP